MVNKGETKTPRLEVAQGVDSLAEGQGVGPGETAGNGGSATAISSVFPVAEAGPAGEALHGATAGKPGEDRATYLGSGR